LKEDETVKNEMLQHLLESIPMEEYEGRSPKEVHHLVYEPFCDNSPMTIVSGINDIVLTRIPFFNLIKFFLQQIRSSQPVVLTSGGNLPKKISQSIGNHNFILDSTSEKKSFKVIHHSKKLSVLNARVIAELAGLIKTRKNIINLTKKGASYISENKDYLLFSDIFTVFTTKFNWSYNDNYGNNNIGQFGFAFTLDLLARYGEAPRNIDFYIEKYSSAFGLTLINIEEDQTNIDDDSFDQCFILRTFERFMTWFGLVSMVEKSNNHEHHYAIQKSVIFDSVLKFD
jgi:hypothetical protein